MHIVRTALLLLVAACTPDYPMDRAGTWSPPQFGANDANLRAMIANPRDLAGGRGEKTSLATEAAEPVTRLFTDRRKPLPASNAAVFQIQQSPTPAAGGSGGAGGQ